MIQANQLRIGNLVGFYKPTKNEMQIGTIKSIIFDDEDAEYKFLVPEFSKSTLIGENSLSPISFSPYWMEKAGFTKSFRPGCIHMYKDLEARMFVEFNQGNCAEMDLIQEGKTIHFKNGTILYLHQFQNWYFAQTGGKELEFEFKFKKTIAS